MYMLVYKQNGLLPFIRKGTRNKLISAFGTDNVIFLYNEVYIFSDKPSSVANRIGDSFSGKFSFVNGYDKKRERIRSDKDFK